MPYESNWPHNKEGRVKRAGRIIDSRRPANLTIHTKAPSNWAETRHHQHRHSSSSDALLCVQFSNTRTHTKDHRKKRKWHKPTKKQTHPIIKVSSICAGLDSPLQAHLQELSQCLQWRIIQSINGDEERKKYGKILVLHQCLMFESKSN
ncbi:uncharacterized protein LOC116195405 isoform X2 [Punica granatum]|uniref:Uncharacterized protein LOC116195405 isoform X2 n=1 Tax=Punica granatum TaxID=22663 RepID=A0A6P8CIE2_PUNGR|nr:uncharacterized protein LOC116195405 isoform X2 [Punica granatum]